MKNILSTIIVFGVIFLLIIIGAYVFDKFNGFGLIDSVDSSINQGIDKLVGDNDSSLSDNLSYDNSSIIESKISPNIDNNTDNISVNVLDNISETIDNSSSNALDKEVSDNTSSSINQQDNISNDNSSLQQ